MCLADARGDKFSFSRFESSLARSLIPRILHERRITEIRQRALETPHVLARASEL